MDIDAYSYLRYSTPPQEWGDSRRRQTEGSMKLAERMGWTLRERTMYQDKGVSAFRSKNAEGGALGRFLSAVQSGAVREGSVLIVESLDRLSRDELLKGFDIVRAIIEAGVKIATVSPERVYDRADINNPLAWVEMIMILSRGHEESVTKSERIRAAWEERRRAAREKGQPISKQTPEWMELTADGYRLIESRADTVRAMFQMAADGHGASSIAAALRADLRRYPPWGRSRTWGPSYVLRILKNPAAWGAYQGRRTVPGGRPVPDGPLTPGHYPAAVGREEWEAVQDKIKGRKGRGGRRGKAESNLFTHLLWNAATGRPMQMRVTRQGGKEYRRLRDELAAGASSPGVANALPYDVLERAVLRHIDGLNLAELIAGAGGAGGAARELQEAEAKLAALDARADELGAQMADTTSPPGVVKQIVKALGKVDAEREQQAERVRSLRPRVDMGPAHALGAAQDAVRLLATVPPADLPRVRLLLKERLRELLTGVWVYVQRFHKKARVAHVQVHYRAGGWTTLVIGLGKLPASARVLSLDKVDLSKGYHPRGRR